MAKASVKKNEKIDLKIEISLQEWIDICQIFGLTIGFFQSFKHEFDKSHSMYKAKENFEKIYDHINERISILTSANNEPPRNDSAIP